MSVSLPSFGLKLAHFKWAGSFIAILLLMLTSAASAKEEFELAQPGYKFSFPRDFAAHDSYQTEWWYFIGHLWTEDKKPYSYELTFFRKSIAPGFGGHPMTDNLFLTVFAVTDTEGNRFFFRQKYDPESSGKIECPEDTFKLRHGNWTIRPEGNKFHLKADSTDFNIDLIVTPEKPPIPMGKDGFARYASCDGCGTHYYLFSRLLTEGTLTVNGEPKKVTGLSFNEHQWGTKLLDEKELGWLWTCIQFANNTELITCHFPRSDGTLDPNSQAALIRPDSSVEYFQLKDFTMKPLAKWRSQTSQQLYPVGAEIEIPKLKLKVITMPDVLNQELRTSGFTYYEGHGTAVADFGGGAVSAARKGGPKPAKVSKSTAKQTSKPAQSISKVQSNKRSGRT